MDNRKAQRMNAKTAKKLRQYAQREYVDLFRNLLSMSFWDRVKIAIKIVFRHG